jgi:hypothetical protein
MSSLQAIHPDRLQYFTDAQPAGGDLSPPPVSTSTEISRPTKGDLYPPVPASDGDYYRPSRGGAEEWRSGRDEFVSSYYSPKAKRPRRIRDRYRPQPSGRLSYDDQEVTPTKLEQSKRRGEDGRLSPWEDDNSASFLARKSSAANLVGVPPALADEISCANWGQENVRRDSPLFQIQSPNCSERKGNDVVDKNYDARKEADDFLDSLAEEWALQPPVHTRFPPAHTETTRLGFGQVQKRVKSGEYAGIAALGWSIAGYRANDAMKGAALPIPQHAPNTMFAINSSAAAQLKNPVEPQDTVYGAVFVNNPDEMQLDCRDSSEEIDDPKNSESVLLRHTIKALVPDPTYDPMVMALMKDRDNVWVNHSTRPAAMEMWEQQGENANLEKLDKMRFESVGAS